MFNNSSDMVFFKVVLQNILHVCQFLKVAVKLVLVKINGIRNDLYGAIFIECLMFIVIMSNLIVNVDWSYYVIKQIMDSRIMMRLCKNNNQVY